jgi:tellurite methyltransferase
MSRQDQARWDEKWAGAGDLYPPHPLLVDHAAYLSGGSALDLACGRGQNAIWLAGVGYHVLGVDISRVALQAARRQALRFGLAWRGSPAGYVNFMVADLDEWSPPRAAFDLVIVFRFLDRRLFGPIREAVRPGGLVYYSTRHLGALARDPRANPRYLLRPGELAAAFCDWQCLYDREGPVDADLIARKPPQSH